MKAPVLALITVLIETDPMTKIPRDVFEHEKRVLELIHGEDKITEVSRIELEFPEFNVADEFHRMKTRYGRKEYDLAEVYRVCGHDGTGIANILGVKMTDSVRAEVVNQSEQVDNTPVGRAKAAAAAKAATSTRKRSVKSEAPGGDAGPAE